MFFIFVSNEPFPEPGNKGVPNGIEKKFKIIEARNTMFNTYNLEHRLYQNVYESLNPLTLEQYMVLNPILKKLRRLECVHDFLAYHTEKLYCN